MECSWCSLGDCWIHGIDSGGNKGCKGKGKHYGGKSESYGEYGIDGPTFFGDGGGCDGGYSGGYGLGYDGGCNGGCKGGFDGGYEGGFAGGCDGQYDGGCGDGEKGFGKRGKSGMDQQQMMEMMQIMLMKGKGRGEAKGCGGEVSLRKNRGPAEFKECSIHGKKRNMQALEEDGLGGFKCKDDQACQMGLLSKEGTAAVSGTAPCSIHGKQRSFISLEDDGMGGLKCKAGMECQTGKGKGRTLDPSNPFQPSGTFICSVHGKMRGIMNLEDDSMGGVRCKVGCECRTGPAPGQDGVNIMDAGAGTFVCSVHGKRRSVLHLEDDSMGGLRCKDGSECNLGSGPGAAMGTMLCQIHGKNRSVMSLEPYMGGFKCKAGFECKGAPRPMPY
mmetsp:Transcript_91949/g.145431  ORF Transcript_91949/g.145431 Transcript_91949/m.145431 type:complete len:387 (+) Transcript_91949:47-1207(+)